jgi:hypothetical protein
MASNIQYGYRMGHHTRRESNMCGGNIVLAQTKMLSSVSQGTKTAEGTG